VTKALRAAMEISAAEEESSTVEYSRLTDLVSVGLNSALLRVLTL
jgi:hypothetical protein